jgi:hypothetical protein
VVKHSQAIAAARGTRRARRRKAEERPYARETRKGRIDPILDEETKGAVIMFPRAATWRRLPRPYGNYKPRVALIVGLTMDTMVTSRNLQIFSNTRIEEGQNLVLRNVFADLKQYSMYGPALDGLPTSAPDV